MIYPTSSDILRCVNQTLLAASDQDMPRMLVKSALATCRHLIRHVDLRLQLERSILLDDIEKTSALLVKLAAHFESLGPAEGTLALHMRAGLSQAGMLLSPAPDEFDAIAARAKALRELIYSALSRLQDFPPERRSAPSYGPMRQAIRDYMRDQMQQEARLIHPAFVGQGPRR